MTFINQIVFVNQQNKYIEVVQIPWLWILLFGPLYLIYKGIWNHFFIWLVLSILTGGIALIFLWIIYPFFMNGIVRHHYLKKGWKEIEV